VVTSKGMSSHGRVDNLRPPKGPQVKQRVLSWPVLLTIVHIRAAGPQDLPELQRVEDRCFQQDRFPPEVVVETLLQPGFATLVAEEDGIIGAVTIYYLGGRGPAQLVSLAVVSEHRGQGVGRGLLTEAGILAASRGARRMILQVGVVNVAAINLYLHDGFVLGGVIGDYYGPGKDAYHMERPL
jgi:[ribosomal protein S18]-alanine N-acetyltransferase